MLQRTFYKAQSTISCQPVESVQITFDDELPEIFLRRQGESLPESLSRIKAYYAEEAKALAQMLLRVLPGGVFDQLLVEMFQIKASHFKVSFGDTERKA